MSAQERDLVRSLAARLAEIAALPIQRENAELWRRLNRLDPVRPMVWLQMLEDSAWPDTGIDATLQCADPFLRRQEQLLKRRLWEWEHQRADQVFDDTVRCVYEFTYAGWGIEADPERSDHWFGSARYRPTIVEEEDLEKLHAPLITVDPEASERKYVQYCDLYDGLLTVEQVGVASFWFSIFDTFIRWRGPDNAFLDMFDRPEWVHRAMRKMTDGLAAQLDWLEEQKALSLNNGNLRVGSQGLGFTDELPQPDFTGTVRYRDLWGHASTQIFVDVSPAMHEEFALRYEAELLARFGLASYGCCEALHHKVDICRKHLPHLRCISMSPWANVEIGAAACGRDLIFAYKPNPAIMAGDTWDPAAVKADLKRVLEITKAHGCPTEILMKDLHTCNGHGERMEDWTRVAVEAAEESV